MPNLEDFEFDSLKNTWQSQEVTAGYNQAEIESMLNKKSRNYVKYILWISIAEFFIFGLINFVTIFSNQFHSDFSSLLNKLQIKNQSEIEFSLDRVYLWMKIFSLIITGVFVTVFYINYKKISVESNLRKFISHIFQFKKTVNLFIFSNVFLLILFIASFVSILSSTMQKQNISLDDPTLWSLISSVIISVLICIMLIFIYYKLAYGLLLKRLSVNMRELEKLDSTKP